MKKFIILILFMIIIITGCDNGRGANGRSAPTQSAGIDEILREGMAEADSAGSDPGSIDVDLTELSSIMVYAEVYNMMVSPEDYIGKTIKMNGLFSYYHDEDTDNEYFFCIVQDATACCAQGIEFNLSGNPVYPGDYPEPDSEICVVGVFDTYDEGEYTYCTLRNARLL